MHRRSLLQELALRMAALENEVSSLRENFSRELPSVEKTLKQRGFVYLSHNPRDKLIFTEHCAPNVEALTYDQMKKYSFRIFLRNVIQRKESFETDDLLQYSTRECVESYLQFMVKNGLAQKKGRGKFALAQQFVWNFGDMLEWFVARVLREEFACPADWGVKLANSRVGGDLDVVAAVSGRLLYVETKSSPPKHVTVAEVGAFLDRLAELQPDCAVFLEDTQLRMRDKIVPMFREALEARRGRRKKIPLVEHIGRGMFKVGSNIFISNSKPDLIANVGICLSNWFRGHQDILAWR